ncbi:PAS domain S-box protein [Methylovulum psychrotolerans]|uniref:histidine kinase n=1 Tax=Methylovulum psychrotolerans TaxID=1704499 RepID=A0A2S5CIF9_9GAMM|nr:PAS domain S-box protein [Methylovulum psychrotolerans]POZ50579.1 sensor domain-containing diguanylate cyclase [Methylovulum psychrotolerans]
MDFNTLYLNKGVFYRYISTLLIFCVALALRFILLPVEAGLAFLTFYPAVVVCFYLCGTRAGILMTVLGAILGNYLFIPPFWAFSYTAAGLIGATVFILSGVLIGFVVHRMRYYAEQFNATLTELQATQLRYREVLEEQTETICRFKHDGTILYVNDAYCRLFGKPRESLIGEKWHPVAYDEDIALINEKLNTLTPDNPVVTIENRIYTAGGALRWGQFINRAFFDDEGYLLEMQSIGRDITEQKDQERQLAQLFFALDHIKEAVYLFDERGHFLYTNKEATLMLGYSLEEFLAGMTVRDICPNWTDAKWAKHWQHIREQGRGVIEVNHLTKLGAEFPVEINANFFQYAGHEFSFELVRDISERKRLEKEREQYYRLFELSTDPLCIADPLGCFKVVNPKFVQLTGYEENELLAKPFLDFVLPEDRQTTLAEMQQQIMLRPTLQFENRYVCKDGSILLLSWSAYFDHSDGVTYATAHDITASRQAEIALLKSEQLFRTLAESVPQIVWMTTPDGSNTYFNRRWIEYTGLTLEESYGQGWIRPFHPDDRQRAWDAWKNATETDGNYSIECRLRRADGTYRWWLIRGKSVHDAEGRISHWFGTCTDIEDIKNTENALLAAEKRLNLALEFSELGVWDLDLLHDTAWRTLKHDQIFGYESLQPEWGEAVAMQHVVPEDRGKFSLAFAEADRTGKLLLECRILHKDQSMHWINAQGRVIYDDNARPVQMLGTVADITERKKMEQEMALAATIFNAQEGMFITDSNRLILRVNQAFTRITGYTQAEVKGKNPHILSSGRHDADFYAQMWATLKSHDVWESEIWNRRKNGEIYPEYLIITAVKDATGEISHYVATFNDITQAKIADQKLAEAYKQLQQSLDIQIRQEKLAALGVLVGGLAHEINNPMMGILNYIQFAYEKTDESRSHEVLGKALREINRVVKLVHNMLTFACYPSGTLHTDIASALNHVMGLIEGDLKKADISLHLDVPQALPQVNISCDALEQILLNLLLNAVYGLKTLTKPRSITITARQLANDTVQLQVLDNGTGVPAEIRQKVFDPFFTTKPPGEGTGLGLAISRQIAESVKGQLELADSPQGACFSINLLTASPQNNPENHNKEF